MSELPKGWDIVPLKEIAVSIKGKKPKILSGVKNKGTVPYIDIKAFEKGEIRQYADINSSNIAGKEDVLVVWDGARSGLVGIGQEGAIGSTILAIKPLYISPHYLYQFLQTKYEHINTNHRGTGIPHVDPEVFWNIEFPIPPLNEQRRIVAKLEKLLHRVDACKERLNKIPAILKRFCQSVLSAACSGRLTADWRERNPNMASKCHSERSEESETLCFTQGDNDENHFPDTWVWKQLSAVADVKGGVTKGRRFNGKKTIFLPYLRVANVQDGYLDLTEIKQIEVLPEDKVKYALKSGDLLFTEGGDRDKLGRGTVWRGEVQDCIHQNHIFRARPLKTGEAIPDYVSITTKSDFSKHYFFENASQTVNLASINIKTLSALPLPIPPLPEQQEIVRRVESLFKKADEIETRYKKAKAFVDKLTQSILAKAFRGELVPQDPNDEPASMLLERIKVERTKQWPKRRGKKVTHDA